MKQRPILFSTPMVQAILEGKKTQTRRIFKEMEPWGDEWEVRRVKEEHMDGIPRYEIRSGTRYALPFIKCPYGQPGDILWVRETWAPFLRGNGGDGYVELIKYAADGTGRPWKHPKDYDAWHNRPSIHMPKDACRIFLRITDIRVERLQEITEEDAKAEGVKSFRPVPGDGPAETQYYHYLKNKWGPSPKHSFQTLWESINGPDSWNVNPWVWVVSFEIIDKPE